MKSDQELIAEILSGVPPGSPLSRQLADFCLRLESARATVAQLQRDNASLLAALQAAEQKEPDISQETLRGIADVMRSGARPFD